jgi:hypothetical protein
MKRRRGYSEKWLELKFAEAMTRNGLRNFHMSAPALPGVPDRYVVGANGLWVEIKQGESFESLSSGFDRQRTFLTALDRGGDSAAVCALLQRPNRTSKLFLEPWYTWLEREHRFKKSGQWDRKEHIWNSPLLFTEPLEMAEAFDNFASHMRATNG